MKKIKFVCCLMMTLLLITGCSDKAQATPSEVVAAFLDAYQSHDNQKIAQYSTWENYDATALELRDEDYMDGVNKDLQKKVYDMMLDFSHKENSEAIQDDTAKVEVSLTMYDFEPTIKSGMEAATKKTEELSKNESIRDEEIQKEILTTLFEHMEKAEKSKSVTTTVHLIKKDKEWKVSEDNNDLSDALLINTQSIQDVAE